MRKSCQILIIALLFTGKINAQQRPKIDMWNPPVEKGIRALQVGEVMPELKISRIFNDSKKTALTSDYKERLLILDFGNTGCSGCVAALPHMEKLQKKFGTKIKIFWVTPEYEADVEGFWNRNRYTRGNTLSTIVEDSTLRAYFKHASWPHTAWIYKGKVIGITSPEYVDADNISRVLRGERVNWPVKDDLYYFDGTKQPLFTIDENQIQPGSTMLDYAAISDYKEKDGASAAGVSGSGGIIWDSVKKTVRMYFINQSIFSAYLQNWNKVVRAGSLTKPSMMLQANQIVWEVKDPKRYIHKSAFTPDLKTGYTGDWMRNNAICFESLRLDTGQTEKDIAMNTIKDLDGLLGLKVRWEKRREKVLVLQRSSKEDRFLKPSGLKDERLRVGQISYQMNQQAVNPYVFDETKNSGEGRMNIQIKSWTDIAAIKKAITPFGLVLKEEERMIDRFIFTEVEGGLLAEKSVQSTEEQSMQK
jgi:thiol-disulfide isomerase/thioredoxin